MCTLHTSLALARVIWRQSAQASSLGSRSSAPAAPQLLSTGANAIPINPLGAKALRTLHSDTITGHTSGTTQKHRPSSAELYTPASPSSLPYKRPQPKLKQPQLSPITIASETGGQAEQHSMQRASLQELVAAATDGAAVTEVIICNDCTLEMYSQSKGFVLPVRDMALRGQAEGQHVLLAVFNVDSQCLHGLWKAVPGSKHASEEQVSLKSRANSPAAGQLCWSAARLVCVHKPSIRDYLQAAGCPTVKPASLFGISGSLCC